MLRPVNQVVGEFVDFLDRAVEIGADDVPVKIADDQQGRIEQRFAIAEQLLVSVLEVLLLAFVFPGEAAFLPHVGKAAFTRFNGFSFLAQLEKKLCVLHHAFLEAEGFAAGRVGLGGCGLAKQPAQVAEVFLVGGRFFALVAVPLSFELCGRLCRMIKPSQR